MTLFKASLIYVNKNSLFPLLRYPEPCIITNKPLFLISIHMFLTLVLLLNECIKRPTKSQLTRVADASEGYYSQLESLLAINFF